MQELLKQYHFVSIVLQSLKYLVSLHAFHEKAGQIVLPHFKQ